MKNRCDAVISFFRERPLLISIVYMCFYFPCFFLLEQFRKPQYIIHCALDDLIPFCEWFAIPYYLWFAFVPVMILLILHRSKEEYFKCCKILYGGMTICLLIYLLFPTGLRLREPVENRNVLCSMINALRSVDTPTNVCPSIHVSSTIGIMLVVMNAKVFHKAYVVKAIVMVLGILICIATVVLDQHSVVDSVCGMLLSTVLYYLVELSAQPQEQEQKGYLRF